MKSDVVVFGARPQIEGSVECRLLHFAPIDDASSSEERLDASRQRLVSRDADGRQARIELLQDGIERADAHDAEVTTDGREEQPVDDWIVYDQAFSSCVRASDIRHGDGVALGFGALVVEQSAARHRFFPARQRASQSLRHFTSVRVAAVNVHEARTRVAPLNESDHVFGERVGVLLDLSFALRTGGLEHGDTHTGSVRVESNAARQAASYFGERRVGAVGPIVIAGGG